MKTRTVLLGCLLAMAVQAQETKRELWTWKDANGVTQYSDRPVPGAKRVELAGVSSPAASTAAPAATAGEPSARAAVPAPVQYRTLEFSSPQNEESFFERGHDGGGTAALRAGDSPPATAWCCTSTAGRSARVTSTRCPTLRAARTRSLR